MNSVVEMPKRLAGTALVQAGKQAKAHIDAAERHGQKAEEQYKAAGAYLVEAKRSVKHGQWLQWLKKYGIAERTAQLCVRIYGNPEELSRERKRKAAHEADVRRKARHGADLPSPNDPIQEPCDDCTTDEEQWQRSLSNMAGDVLAARAFWSRQFGKWEAFDTPASLLKLAEQASEEWKEIAKQLRRNINVAA